MTSSREKTSRRPHVRGTMQRLNDSPQHHGERKVTTNHAFENGRSQASLRSLARAVQRGRYIYALMLSRARIKTLLCAGAIIFGATSVAMAAKTTSCESLSELACIKSPTCTLVQVETNRYLCRVATGKCELGFIQWGEKQQERCESKPGCAYVPGNCYCRPDVACPCGGGKPPQCIERG